MIVKSRYLTTYPKVVDSLPKKYAAEETIAETE